MVACAPRPGLPVRLAASPPSHRKDQPLERCGGILANHWHGARLDALEAVLQCATTMPWQGQGPGVALVTPP